MLPCVVTKLYKILYLLKYWNNASYEVKIPRDQQQYATRICDSDRDFEERPIRKMQVLTGTAGPCAKQSVPWSAKKSGHATPSRE